MKKLAALLLVSILLTMALPSTAETYTKYSTSFFGTFDTVITLMGYATEQATYDAALAQVKAAFERYHAVYDAYGDHEGVKGLFHLNANAAQGPVEVEPELMDLLLYCREQQPLTEGAVNVALGAVLAIWHDYREASEYDPLNAELPPMALLEAAAEHADFDDVIIDEAAGTVLFADPKLRLDIGAVAKGYATEQVAQQLLTSEMPSFLLYAGGNVRTGEQPLDGRQRWGVGIQNPNASIFADADVGTLDTLFTKNNSVVTSGDYERFYVVDDMRLHHLISPFTLMPADHFRSVTVVCEDSGLADLLSTCFFILPYAQGRALADSMDGVEVYWVLNDADMTIEMTDGMRAMAKSQGASSVD